MDSLPAFGPKHAGLLVLLIWLFGAMGCSNDDKASMHLELAEALQAEGKVSAAIIELQTALQIEPDLIEALWQLGQIHLALGDGPAASKELERVGALGRRDDALAIALTNARLMQGRYKEVLGYLSTIAIKDRPELVVTMRGEARFGLREIEAARAAFARAVELAPDDARAKRGLARVAIVDGEFKLAGELIAQSLEREPNDVQTWLLKGRVHLEEGSRDEALSAFKRAEELVRDAPEILLSIVRVYVELRQFDQADALLAALYSRLPKHPVVNFLRGMSARHRGDSIAARTALRESLRVDPNQPQSAMLLGTILYEDGELAQAGGFLSRGLKAIPTYLPGRKLLAATRLRNGETERAVEVLEEGLTYNSGDAQLLAMLGSAYLASGDRERGAELLRQSVELDPNAPLPRSQLAVSLFASGKAEEAEAMFEQSIVLAPEFIQADFLLIYSQLLAQAWDKAIEAAQRLAAKRPEDPVPYNLIGSALMGKGETELAESSFHRALQLDPTYSSARLNLALVAIGRGDLKDAEQYYRAILDRTPGHADASVALARLSIASGAVEPAILLLAESVEANLQASGPAAMLVQALILVGRQEDAFRTAQELMERLPSDTEAQLTFARATLGGGDATRARYLYERLVKAAPSAIEARLELARLNLTVGQTRAAKDGFEEVLLQKGDNVDARIGLGNVALAERRFDDALQIGQEIASTATGKIANRAIGHLIQGEAHLRTDDATAALAAYDKAFTATPNSRVVNRRFIATRIVHGSNEAQQVLEQWLEVRPKDAATWNSLGTLHFLEGRELEAMEAYETVISIVPEHAQALNNLAVLYSRHNRDEEALAIAERAYKRDGNDALVADTYGWLLVNSGSTEQGLSILESAARVAPGNMEIQYHLATALRNSGEEARATRLLEQVVESKQDFADKETARKAYELLR
jgi:putative PEP-CTERM system TPR-repeat lipoprotein